MAAYSVQMTLFPTSGTNADAITNSWSCEAATDADALAFAGELISLYDTNRSMFSDIIRQNNHVFKVFNRADPTPRVPTDEGTFNFTTAPSGAPCPPEVALVMSFQGAAASGTPQARRRGRVYFGPLDASFIDSSGRPNATLLNLLDGFGTALLAASGSAGGWEWGVYSTVDAITVAVINGWVDDEFDTQRRRGRLATIRQTFP